VTTLHSGHELLTAESARRRRSWQLKELEAAVWSRSVTDESATRRPTGDLSGWKLQFGHEHLWFLIADLATRTVNSSRTLATRTLEQLHNNAHLYVTHSHYIQEKTWLIAVMIKMPLPQPAVPDFTECT